MTVYIGVDFHPYEQSVAYVDEVDGEIRYKRFVHSDQQSIKAFYRKCGENAVVGVEATGCLWWFQKLLAEAGFDLMTGDPRLSGEWHSHVTRTTFAMRRRSLIWRVISGNSAQKRRESRDPGSVELSAVFGTQGNVTGEPDAGVCKAKRTVQVSSSSCQRQTQAVGVA